jgi:hypothetical protein
MSTIQRALYCNLCAKYSLYSLDYAMWTVFPDIYNVFTAPHIQASIFNWKCLYCCQRYVDNSVSLILQTWCQIKRTTSSLRNVVCGPGHIKCIYSSTYSGFNIQLNVSPPLLEIYRQFSVRYTANMVLIQRKTSRLHNVNCGPGHIHCTYSSTYSGFNIQQNVAPLLLEISPQFNERYTATWSQI